MVMKEVFENSDPVTRTDYFETCLNSTHLSVFGVLSRSVRILGRRSLSPVTEW